MKSILRRLWARKRLIVVLIVIAAIAYFAYSSRNGNGKELEEGVVSRGTVEEDLVLTGEVKAIESANLQFNTSGTLSWVGVKVGDIAKKGQALMKLDTVKLNAAYQVAASSHRAAQANAEEVLDDVKGNDKDETFEEKNTRTAAESARDKAWDTLVAAQKDLADATLIAPFNGLVAIVTNEAAGVNITAGVSQVTLVNPSTIYFLVNADQTEVSDFKVGDSATILLDAFSDEEISGTITSVSIAPDPSEAGTVYPIRVALNADNASYKYKLGMTGDARFVLSKKDNALYVPGKFVRTDREGQYVLVNDGKDKKYVETGIEGEENIEIVSGVLEGEKIYY